MITWLENRHSLEKVCIFIHNKNRWIIPNNFVFLFYPFPFNNNKLFFPHSLQKAFPIEYTNNRDTCKMPGNQITETFFKCLGWAHEQS